MEGIKKIQLSPVRIVNDAVTVWNKPGEDVDIVMDLHNLTFRNESIEEIYSFHVLDHLFNEEIIPAIKNWKSILSKTGELWVVANDFEFISRGFVGGDFPIEFINENFSTPVHLTRHLLIEKLESSGFLSDGMRVWHVDVDGKFSKKDFELVISAQNNG